MTREEAIDIIRKNIPHLGIGATEMTDALEELIPELRESEDDRIRKLPVSLVTVAPTFSALAFTMKDSTDCFSYLEKQKEQKPAEKQDYSGLNDLERAIHRGFLCAGVENVSVTIIKETAKECLAQMKPAECIEDSVKFEEGFKAGREVGARDMKEQMMKEWLKDRDGCFWDGVEEGKKAIKDAILVLIESRLSEIIGDAQPKPILRAELEELINRINNGKD